MSVDCDKITQIVQQERKELDLSIVDSKGVAVDLTGVTNIQSVHPTELGGYLIKELETVGQEEITEITTAADVSQSLAGKYFNYFTPNGQYAFWFQVDGVGAAPGLTGVFLRQVNISENDTADTVATALQIVMDAQADISASVLASVVTATNSDFGSVVDASDGSAGFTFNVTQQGITTITDSIEVTSVQGQVKIKLKTTETSLLKVENRATIHLAVDFPTTGRKIYKIKEAYDVCGTDFTLN